MAKVSLENLADIDGFMAAALVDSQSGLAMAVLNHADVDLDLAAAGNSEVINAKRKTARSLGLKGSIEDILITLESQYHMMRPLHGNRDLFMYIVLDKAKSNLAMARHELKAFEEELDFS